MYERRMSRPHTYFWGGKVNAQGGAGGRRRDACATSGVVGCRWGFLLEVREGGLRLYSRDFNRLGF
ncbi:hypothetical protein [Kamptonema formosum]|uniref:hypothetical protein n=1 Tax=Kamptonema formosum TaxID=331992 RepID=UPI00034D4795|nr:hypothetical protein [Oscillatoria sp. PCC 10802]